MKLKKILFGFIMAACMLSVQLPNIAFGAGTGDEVKPTEADTRVVPDKYNTGCQGELTTLVWDTENAMYVGDIFINRSGDNFVLDFGYRNLDKSGTIYIENWDFSSNPLVMYNEDRVDRQIKVVFYNCKFARVSTGRDEGNMSYEFNNCSMISFYGSNTVLNRCKFGGSFVDGIVPFMHIEVNDCFFGDMTGVETDGNVHIDGTQIYGHANNMVYDVAYNNCRFEMPALVKGESAARINACIMLGLEFNNAKDVSFNDCILNGGGYTMYAGAKYPQYTFTNVKFDGIRFGAAAMYGYVYPSPNPAIEMTDMGTSDLLYVGTVWKENGETHFSVTNDTGRERTLVIYTDKGIYTHTIPACPKITKDNNTQYLYEDMPFDIDIVVPEDCQYAVCFDNTLQGYGKQIRFMNWGDTDVYFSEDIANLVSSGNGEDVLVSGNCGNDITFTLTKSGILTLTGTGSTYNYHSQKFPEWNDYSDYIKEIRVGEGIEGLGNMIFRGCSNVEKVTLPDSLRTIGTYGFGGCVSLAEFTLPANIEVLGNSVLQGMILQQVHYVGDDWGAISLGTGNEVLEARIVLHTQMAFINAFVDRMYNVALDRESDEAGKANWSYMLIAGTHDGAGLAKEFILGEEFALRNLTDEEFIDVLYKTFFNREADEEGKNNWLIHLQAGYSRAYVLSNFVNLSEFTELCASYGIERGVMLSDGTAVNPGIPNFVERLYKKVLGRNAETSGLYNNVVVLYYKTMSAEAVASNFFGSQEYAMKDTDNSTYVSDLYSVFMDRAADEEGLDFWVSCLEQYGMTREQVLAEFSNSTEFKAIAASYGL